MIFLCWVIVYLIDSQITNKEILFSITFCWRFCRKFRWFCNYLKQLILLQFDETSYKTKLCEGESIGPMVDAVMLDETMKVKKLIRTYRRLVAKVFVGSNVGLLMENLWNVEMAVFLPLSVFNFGVCSHRH